MKEVEKRAKPFTSRSEDNETRIEMKENQSPSFESEIRFM